MALLRGAPHPPLHGGNYASKEDRRSSIGYPPIFVKVVSSLQSSDGTPLRSIQQGILQIPSFDLGRSLLSSLCPSCSYVCKMGHSTSKGYVRRIANQAGPPFSLLAFRRPSYHQHPPGRGSAARRRTRPSRVLYRESSGSWSESATPGPT